MDGLLAEPSSAQGLPLRLRPGGAVLLDQAPLVVHDEVRRATAQGRIVFHGVAPAIQDRIQNAVLRALDCSTESTILVAHPKPLILVSLVGDLVRVGRRVILATTQLETVRWLCDPDTMIQVVLVDQSHAPNFGRAILELIAEDFPQVRRVALCDTSVRGIAETLSVVEADDVLDVPWTQSEIESILVRPKPRVGRSSTSSP